jgi:lysophospholipase L1-like esterase
MKILYANGDSWTEGDEIPSKSRVDVCKNTLYYESWPYKLSRSLNIPLCINDGGSAGSNPRIFRTTLDYIIKYVNFGKDPSELLIVIGWTTPERTEININKRYARIQSNGIGGSIDMSNKEIMSNLKEYQRIYYELYDDDIGMIDTIRMMNTLRMLCKAHDIRYYDFIAIGKSPNIYNDISIAEYDSELYNLHPESWAEHCYRNNLSKYKYGHPTVETHEKWASILAERIKQL